jgi:hypothetical protein
LMAGLQVTPAEQPVITSFSQNGVLVCSNLAPGSVATIAWASSLAGPWQTNWTSLTAVRVGTNGTIRVSVPMYYRVLGLTNTPSSIPVTLLQLLGSSNTTHLATNFIQQSSAPTPISTSLAVFDAAHQTIWVPVSYAPDWPIGTLVYWGSSIYKMRVEALGAGQIQFRTLSGNFGLGSSNVISTTLSYTLSNAVTAAASWQSPGVGNAVVVPATAVSANLGDVVWVGGVGGNQFRVVAIPP